MKQMIPAMMPAYIDEKGGWKVWCPYCGCLHGHGAEPGYRCPPCCYYGSPYPTLPRGYYLIPTGQPLPDEAKKLDRKAWRIWLSKLGAKNPKPHRPPQVPEWGRPITSYETAHGLMTEWTYWTSQSEEERKYHLSNFKQAWDCFTAYGERQDKLRAMNIDPDIFTECLRDVLTFDE